MRRIGRVAATALVALAYLSLTAVSPASAQSAPVVAFAAASLKKALDDIDAAYAAGGGVKAIASYGASPALARQIEAGAPADVFISADLDWMDYVANRHLIKAETRSDLLGNEIVLVAPAANDAKTTIAKGFPLAALLGDGRLAMADPASVPAGKYGKAALEALGVWSEVAGKVAPAENVRAALLLVSRGEAPLGIVYRTDAAAEPGVRIVGSFPADTHPPIVYPVAIVASSSNPNSAGYIAFLRSAAARAAFMKQGFTLLE